MNKSDNYYCNICNFATEYYESWLFHLISEEHQRALIASPGFGEAGIDAPGVRDKVIIVRTTPSRLWEEVVNHFSTCGGTIVNFIFRGRKEDVDGDAFNEFLIVLSSREALLSATTGDGCWIFGQRIDVRPFFEDFEIQPLRPNSSLSNRSPAGTPVPCSQRLYEIAGFSPQLRGNDDSVPSSLVERSPQTSISSVGFKTPSPSLSADFRQPIGFGYYEMTGNGSDNYSYDDDFLPSPIERRSRREREQATMNVSVSPSSSEDEENEDMPVKVNLPGPEVVEESSWELDTADEEYPVEDDRDRFCMIRKGKIRVNQSLRKCFEKAVAKIPNAEDILLHDVRMKFQNLWWNSILQFNNKFWEDGFGFGIDVEIPTVLYVSENVNEDASNPNPITLKESFDSINNEQEKFQYEFQCNTNDGKISAVLHKKKIWKQKYLLSQILPLWTVIGCTNKSKNQNIDLSLVRQQVPIKKVERMEFNGKIEITYDSRKDSEIPKNDNISAFVTLSLSDIPPSDFDKGKSLRIKKLRFLISMYERLAYKYCNLKIKEWIATCSDISYDEFNTEYKKERKRAKGHPRWKKFKKKFELMRKKREKLSS